MWQRIAIFTLIAGAMCLATGCSKPPGAGVRWTNYSKLSESPVVYKWLVVKCQFADVQTIPTEFDTNINQFLGGAGIGYGNMIDYYHDISYNGAEFHTDFVDWVPAPFKLADIKGQTHACFWSPGPSGAGKGMPRSHSRQSKA